MITLFIIAFTFTSFYYSSLAEIAKRDGLLTAYYILSHSPKYLNIVENNNQSVKDFYGNLSKDLLDNPVVFDINNKNIENSDSKYMVGEIIEIGEFNQKN